MIVAVGDSHGVWPTAWPERATAFVHVGDFGYWPRSKRSWGEWIARRPVALPPVYFVDGNHDDCDALTKLEEVTEVWPGAFYCPRGTVLELDGLRVGFCGGSDSVDRRLRPSQGVNAWQLTEKLTDNVTFEPDSLDVLITHCAPQSMLAALGKRCTGAFYAARGWVPCEDSSRALERIWRDAGAPPLLCGHYHEPAEIHEGSTVTVRVLAENEMLDVQRWLEGLKR